MAQPRIEDLFDNSRWPSGIPFILALVYFPFGILLALVRLFIGFHTFIISCLLPKLAFIRSIILRIMCTVLGIVVTVDKRLQLPDEKVKVMVANYTSTLDHLAVDLIQPSILPCVWDLPPTLMWLLGYVDMGAKKGRETLIENAKIHCENSNIPLLVFPEGASTNGKKGLLKFSAWPFSLEQKVQPVLIQIKRPIVARLSPSILGGRWWRDVFWTLFVPYTSFHIKLLPLESKGEDETVEEFTKRLQVLMATHLSLLATTHTTVDKVEYAKRKLFIHKLPTKKHATTEGNATKAAEEVDQSIQMMVKQVQDVFPHIPVSVIQKDLILSKDVDLTITNILEGRVEESSEVVTPGGDQTTSSSPKSMGATPAKSDPSPTLSSTAASSFPRSSQQRHLSLSERKQALIDFAKQRYIEKHGLAS